MNIALPAPVVAFFERTESQKMTFGEKVQQFGAEFPGRSFGADATVWLYATVPVADWVAA